jgi:hypothetical protein
MQVHARNQAGRDACGAGDVGLWISNAQTCWNPLTDDGDALRLAVKLGMDVCFGANYVIVRGSVQTPTVNSADDPYAATRRAIVRAAAEIGRNMK